MSAINLYTTKAEALYFKDSQRNNFYEFGGIQLLPNTPYVQKFNITTVDLGNGAIIGAYSVSDDSFLGNVNLLELLDEPVQGEVYANNNIIRANSTTKRVDYLSPGDKYYKISSNIDFGSELLYLVFSITSNKTLANSTAIRANSTAIRANNLYTDYISETFYTNPFYITSFDEDRCTKVEYADNLLLIKQSVGLKFWFRQKSRQSELTTYYESSTKNTVTQNIKTHNLEMYESEFMSIEDLIMTAEILESPYLYIGSKRYSLFEAVKIPELTQQENFAKIKFTLAPNN